MPSSAFPSSPSSFCFFFFLFLSPVAHSLHSSISSSPNHRIFKRFVLHRHRWDHCRLSWAFRDPFWVFSTEEHFLRAKKVIGEAIRSWQQAGASGGGLQLVDASPSSRHSPANARRAADIDIFFARRAHGDAEAFDGRGGLVAHSAYPPVGIVHFDASERWKIGEDEGEEEGEGRTEENRGRKTKKKNEEDEGDEEEGRGGIKDDDEDDEELILDLKYVALHEIGHAFGLRHSSYKHSVMNRYYKRGNLTEKGMRPNGGLIRLSKDDEEAIGELFEEMCRKIKRRKKRRGE